MATLSQAERLIGRRVRYSSYGSGEVGTDYVGTLTEVRPRAYGDPEVKRRGSIVIESDQDQRFVLTLWQYATLVLAEGE